MKKRGVLLVGKMEPIIDIIGFSGGRDSLAAWYLLNKPLAIYINCKTKYSEKELKCIKNLQKLIPELKVKIIECPILGSFEYGSNAYIKYRNLIFACLMGNYGKKVRIIIAGNKSDNVEDKSKKAFKIMTDCLNSISKEDENIEVYSPFWKMTKTQLIAWFLNSYKGSRKKVEKILQVSISCYSKENGNCGKCPACLRSAISLFVNKVPINFFVNDITKYIGIKNYIKKMKTKDNPYDRERVDESLRVFEKWGWRV